jgi:lambda repressor-like predicted transcriptional regulator
VSISTANTHHRQTQGEFALAVKTALLTRGQTVTDLAQKLGFARNTVSIAINHASMLPTVKRAIANHLGLAA